MAAITVLKRAVTGTMTQADNPVPTCSVLPKRQYTAEHEKPLLLHEEQLIFPDHASQLSSADIIEPIQKNNSMDSIAGTTLRSSPVSLSSTQITALSGAIAGFLSGVAVCPLDVAKTRLQAQGLQTRFENPYYRGILGTLSTIVRDEGPQGLYKGLVPIVLGYFPTWMIYFSVYEVSKKFFHGVFTQLDFIAQSCAAITAGAASTTLTNPIWVVKTRLMLQSNLGEHPTHYRGTFDALKKISSQEGFKALYAGLVPSLLGLFHVAIHFPIYEELKIRFHCYSRADNGTSIDLQRLIMASSVSKMIASTVTYPHEILRTRMQLKSDVPDSIQRRLFPLIKATYAQEGLKGFYSGFTTNLIRTIPASAITLVSFEYFRNRLENINSVAI
ncbi:hypothetical protein SEUBUCD646_0I01670 [Saccharomyces eubayanus]|uniref:Mitochondrial NAD+ transporter n=2 Tax=Saccharomyces TaxID=4930 RepID=A0A6C1EAF8_SACPS|nr:Mitochondrial NAD+ transporter [Saccharomyces pastorianus]CAI2040720.1 hypothetical protein SEUBUCD650_0I01660 [Saccharomyces eubayanus]CAI2051379.1 hypothetical protein SEUBUCD646_0I01670 [Saccharomyces eubayanus]